MKKWLVAALLAFGVAAAVHADPIRIGNTYEDGSISGSSVSSSTYTGTVRVVCTASCHVALSSTNVHTEASVPLFLPANDPVDLTSAGATRYVLVLGSSGNFHITELSK